MRALHKLQLAYARARLARGKIRNARPYRFDNPDDAAEWDDAAMFLDRAMNAIDTLIVRQKRWEKANAASCDTHP
jgi:hypothetical protein